MLSFKYFSVIFLGILLGMALSMPGATISNAAGSDVPSKIFIEQSSKAYSPDNLINNGMFWNTKIKIRKKYRKTYRFGSVSISADKKGILAMVTRIDK